MKKRYAPIVMLLAFQFCHGQSSPQPNNNYGLPKIVAPSQETFASSRISFKQTSSGEFNYQFPVFNDIMTPIALSYTSGVRVDDIGTSTGMSWQMGYPGVISRVVKDETDENNPNWKPETISETADLQKIKDAALTGNVIDTEYDWFNFSVANGLSGSFYINKDLQVFSESGDKVKIEIFDMNAPVPGYGKLLKFILTDKYGNEYYFGGSLETIERSTTQGAGPDRSAITGWYLYKIISTEKQETNFTYGIENLTYYSSLNAGFNVQQSCTTAAGNPYVFSNVIKSKSIQQSYKPKLTGISEDNKNISFIYGKARNDLFNSNAENNLLTSIEIRNGSILVEKYNLEYQDVQSPVAETYYGLPSDENSTRNRHFLKSIKNITKNISTDFSYYNLEKLPARFSLNTDYYGYTNAASNTSPFPVPGPRNNFGIFKGFSNIMPLTMLSANKEVEPLWAAVGNLKQITHPAKGISEIFYEPNSSSGPVAEEVKETFGLEPKINRCKPSTSHPVESFTFVSNGSPITFFASAAFDEVEGCSVSDFHDTHRLTVIDVTTGAQVYATPTREVSYDLNSDDGGDYHPVNTINGHSYKIEYTVYSAHGAVSGAASGNYNSRNIMVNKMLYFGGSRLSSIKESDVEGHSYTKKFYYNPLADIANSKTSIADYNLTYIAAEGKETSKSCQFGIGTFPSVEILSIYTAYQDSFLPNYNHRKNKVLYTDITEVIENKSAVERKFSYYDNAEPNIGRPPAIYNLPNTNVGEIKSDLLLEENTYKAENSGFSKMTNKKYRYDYSQIKSLKSYVFKENFTYYPDPSQDQLMNISHGFYENYYGFYNPTEIKTTEYFPNNVTLVTTNTNSYSNPNHYQLTSFKTEHPDHTVQETTYSYAHEKGNQLMIDKNMVGIPLETKTQQMANNITKVTSREETIYPTALPHAVTGNLVLPLSEYSYDSLSPTVSSKEVTYEKYDEKGNILQYREKDGTPVSIVWGYNKTNPIAKVVGSTYSQIEGMISTIVTKSNEDAADPTKEAELLQALDAFQPAGMVTTYTYDPLVGVTTITPPSGVRELYVYDSANRLKQVQVRERDNAGAYSYKVVKEFKYNYKQ